MCHWHETDLTGSADHVRSWGRSGLPGCAPGLPGPITDQWDVTRDTRPQGTEQGRALNLRFATWTYVLSNPCPLEWASSSFRRRR